METVTILRELWRRRRLVVIAAIAAIVVGMLLTFTLSFPPQSRKYEVGVASARILVDTPNSQVVEVAPRGSDALGARASLLSNLMTEGEVKGAIARRAGLRPRKLVAGTETDAEPVPASAAKVPPSELYLLTTRLVINAGGDPLPIIEVTAQAPDAARANKLATAAVTGLGAYLDSKAAVEQVADAQRLRVTGLGVPQVRADVRGPRRVLAFVAALFVFLLGCGAIVAFSALARSWRAAEAEEKQGGSTGHPSLLLGSSQAPPPEPRATLPTPERAASR